MISHEVHLLMGSLLYLHSDYTDKTIHCFGFAFDVYLSLSDN